MGGCFTCLENILHKENNSDGLVPSNQRNINYGGTKIHIK